MADGLAAKESLFGFDDIVAVAALFDVMFNDIFFNDFFELRDKTVQLPVSGMGCSGFAAWGSATFDGRAIHGANQDLPTMGVFDRQTIVTVAKPDKGNAFLQVSFPGWFLASGMNEAGILTSEMISTSSDTNLVENPEIPHTLHMRMIVQYTDDLEGAKEIIRNFGGAVGWNNLVTDSKTRTAVDIECSATRMGPVYSWDDPSTPSINENQGLCVTNQYMSCPGFRGYSGENLTKNQMEYDDVDTSSWGTGDKYKEKWKEQFEKYQFQNTQSQKEVYHRAESWYRWSRLWDLYKSRYGSISVDDVIAFMSDTKKGPQGRAISGASSEEKWFDGTSFPHIKGPGKAMINQGLASVYSCVFDPESGQKGVIWVAAGAKPAQTGVFYPIDFEEELNKMR